MRWPWTWWNDTAHSQLKFGGLEASLSFSKILEQKHDRLMESMGRAHVQGPNLKLHWMLRIIQSLNSNRWHFEPSQKEQYHSSESLQ